VVSPALNVSAGNLTTVTLVMHMDSVDTDLSLEEVKKLNKFDILDI